VYAVDRRVPTKVPTVDSWIDRKVSRFELAAGHILEELRGCMSVPPKIERKLRLYAAMNPAEVRWIERILMFRKFVAREFERLVREGNVVSERPEMEEPDSDIGEGGFADAFDQTTEFRTA
jgi:hypothetical protein